MAAKQISSLAIRVGANTAPLADAFRQAGNITSGFASKIKSIGANAVSVFAGVAAFQAISAAVRSAYHNTIGLVKEQLEAIDVTAKLSDRLGATTEALAGLQHAASLAGVSNESLTKGLEKYLRTVGEAVSGNKTAAKAFADLGLDAAELAKLPTDKAMAKIAAALNAIENPALRAAAAQEIFGRAGQELLPLLIQGSEALEAQIKEAEALGLTFSRIDGAKVEAANDAITRAKSAIVGIGRTLSVAVAPYIQMLADRFTEFGKRAVASVKSIVPRIIENAIRIVNVVTPYIQAFWNLIVNVFSRIVGFVRPIVQSIYQAVASRWQAILTSTIQYGLAVYDLIKSVLNAAWSIVSAVASGIATAWTWAMNLFGVKAEEGSNRTQSAFQTIIDWSNWFKDQISMIFTTISFVLDNWSKVMGYVGVSVAYEIVRMANWFKYQFTEVIPAYLSWFADNFTNIIRDAFNLAATIASNGISNIAKIIWNLPSLIRGKVTLDELWTPLTDGFVATIGELPELAERVPGTLEKAFGDEADKLGRELTEGFGERLAESQRQAKETADQISGAFKDLMPKMPSKNSRGLLGAILDGVKSAIPAPKIETPTFNLDTDLASEQIESIKSEIKGIEGSTTALLEAGSADAWLEHAKLGVTAEMTSLENSRIAQEMKEKADGKDSEKATLDKSLDVQRKTLDVLEDIAASTEAEETELIDF